ncbi:MAG: hypothetical protein DRQ41_01395 [Gammaproteobacteria bacterium]|nr:MAG: hypothetical protein DRQ41_01395 [Gammaproteobacteria bacterium]
MKIRKLNIKNYKLFDNLELDFTDENGKTLKAKEEITKLLLNKMTLYFLKNWAKRVLILNYAIFLQKLI